MPTINIREVITINNAASTIFNYLVDVSKRREYVPALKEVIMLDPLPIRTGSRYIEVAVIAGRTINTTYQVTDFKKDKKIAAKTIKSVFPIEVNLILENYKGGTMLSIDMEFILKGIFRYASPIVQQIVRIQARGILEKLKVNIENG